MEKKPNNANSELAERLAALYRQRDQGPFPYEDIRKLVQKAGTHHEGLIPDLDLYFSTIVGYCSWGKRILNWDADKRHRALTYAKRGFFERHPEYKSLLPLIRESNLSKQLDDTEEMRTALLQLLISLD